MPLFDGTIWIVHREPGSRAALARLVGTVGARNEIVLAAPLDPIFEAAPAPDLVLLGLPGHGADLEREIEWVRGVLGRNPGCGWLLIGSVADSAYLRSIFDSLDAELVRDPPDARLLAGAIANALRGRRAEPLSARIGRDRLAARIARWFGRDEPTDLGHAIAGRNGSQRLLALGEPGTGRGLLLRYAHVFSGHGTGSMVRVGCQRVTRAEQLLNQIRNVSRPDSDGSSSTAASGGGRFGVWFDEIDLLSAELQTQVLDWIEYGLPAGIVRGQLRWLASASDGGDSPDGLSQLDVRLERALGELTLRTRPLRMQPEIIESFVAATSRAWCSARGEPLLSFSDGAVDLLRAEPWPGNMAELEATVIRTLAHLGRDRLTAQPEDLLFETGAPPRPAVRRADPAADLRAEAPVPQPASAAVPSPPAASTTPEALEPRAATTPDAQFIHRLTTAVAHEVRNPLVSIRTFSELLPEHHSDPEFRSRFSELVGSDIRKIEQAVNRLQRIGAASAATRDNVDATAVIEELLEAETPRIQSQSLLVLRELDRHQPEALTNRDLLSEVLQSLFDLALRQVPVRGGLYISSKHYSGKRPSSKQHFVTGETADADDGPILRILLRYTGTGETSGGDTPTLRELEHVLDEAIINALGGSLSVDYQNPSETVVVLDLPAPSP